MKCSFGMRWMGLLPICALVLTIAAFAQKAPSLEGIPGPLAWHNQPVATHVPTPGSLTIVSGANTDWYVDAFEAGVKNSAPILTFDPGPNYVLSTRVQVQFRSRWDAGALMLYVDDHHWAKLSFENSVDKQPTMVSVVTRGTSDDCNSVPIAGNSVYLQIARRDDAFIFYYSLDGKSWNMLRIFRLDTHEKILVGFESQSPDGPGAEATFSEIRYEARRIPNPYTGKD